MSILFVSIVYNTDMTKHVKLSEEQIERFTDARAANYSPAKAMIVAQPELALNKNYANVKGRRLLKKTDVQEKIQKKMERMSNKAIKRIDTLIQSDDESIATTNSWRVVEQVRGKAVTRSINLNATATIEDALFD